MGERTVLPGDFSSLTFPTLNDDASMLLQMSESAWKERASVLLDSLSTFAINRGLSASLKRLRIGLVEGLAIESPRAGGPLP